MKMEIVILNILQGCSPHTLTEVVLWSEARLDLPGAHYGDFMAALEALERKGQVLSAATEDRRHYKIGAAGTMRLRDA